MTPTHCPDCGQSLSEPQRSIGYLGPHPIWCATCDGCHEVDLGLGDMADATAYALECVL